MEITEQDFMDTKEISIELDRINPLIKMMDGKRVVFQIEASDEDKGNELFYQLIVAWNDVKEKEKKET